MNKLEINITKAQLLSYSVDLKEGKPEVHATIGLFTDGGKKISDYTIFTNGWNDETKFELPVELMPLIGDTMRILEGVVIRHCRDGQKALPAASNIDEEAEAQEADANREEAVVIEDIDDKPINLDDINF